MKVYGLVGKSGTGKSYQALALCKEKNIKSIIDDGLFIIENSVCAGKSAKREERLVGAIKTALFTEEEHKNQVRESISLKNPASILVLGTSERMIGKIIARLELPNLSEMIKIEEITSEREREIARKQRMELGKHVIPVATFQIKKDFSGYFLDQLKILKKIGSGKHIMTEKSVVRPTYSYLGGYTISEKAVTDIICYAAIRITGVGSLYRISVENKEKGITIGIDFLAKYGYNIVEVGKRLQTAIIKEVEKITAFNVIAVNVTIKGLE